MDLEHLFYLENIREGLFEDMSFVLAPLAYKQKGPTYI